jgi:hypothetical protein
MNENDKTTPPPTAKLLEISTSNFSVKATNPLTIAYYAYGVHGYANVVIQVNGTMQKSKCEVQVAKDGHSLMFVCAICTRSCTRPVGPPQADTQG